MNARYDNSWYYCWLIERRDGPQPRWLGEYTWVTDANDAIWYARKSDAEAVCDHDLKGTDKVVVCEHGFDTGEVAADAPKEGRYFAQQCFLEGCQRRVMAARIADLEKRLARSREGMREVVKIAQQRGDELAEFNHQ